MTKTLGADCTRCGCPHRWDPVDCTITLEKRTFWLKADCPDRGVPLRLRLAAATVIGLRNTGILLDPAVRDHLHRKGML